MTSEEKACWLLAPYLGLKVKKTNENPDMIHGNELEMTTSTFLQTYLLF